MNLGRSIVLAAMALGLGACGTRAELRPDPGQSLPVAPYGREVRPSAEELLARPPQAAPERNIELRRRSEEREDDPFDLPPEEIPGDPDELPDGSAPGAAGECPPTTAADSRAVQLAKCSALSRSGRHD